MLLWAFLTTVLGACQAISFEYLILEEWQAFKNSLNKTYHDKQEEHFRREIFLENRHKIALHNIGFGEGRASFKMNINRFADMLNHEFTNIVNGFNRTSRISRKLEPAIQKIRASSFIRPFNSVIPDKMDWRELGGVTPVKFQGKCGSCYAFSAAGALEGHWYRKTGILPDLSAQNIMDCSNKYGNSGCLGGLVDGAYEYIRDNPGVDLDGAYPYEAVDGTCRYKPEARGADDTGYVLLDEGDEEAIKAAVATLGPVSAVMDAGQDTFQFYSSGVYYEASCESAPEKMNHAVLIVGYGTEGRGRHAKDYWLVKNSYGSDWGMGGYIKLARNINHCGIATSASYPLV